MRATQFFEFVGGVAQSAIEGQTARLPAAMMQPIASDDVAAALEFLTPAVRYRSLQTTFLAQTCKPRASLQQEREPLASEVMSDDSDLKELQGKHVNKTLLEKAHAKLAADEAKLK